MDDRAALQRAALHYCISARQDVRDRAYSGRSFTALSVRDPHSDLAWRDLRARQAILFAIQAAIKSESLSAAAVPTLDDLRARFVELGRSTPPAWSECVPIEQEERAIAEERERFCAYVEQVTTDELQRVSTVAVPTARDLTPRERDRIWTRLSKRWGVARDAVWYPLQPLPVPPPPHVLAFEADWFAWDVPLATLRGILKSRRVRRVWELMNSRLGDAKELDVALFVPSGSETYWTSQKMDWMIYASHESSLTICGDWLLNLVKQAWPAWAEHLYRGYEYQRPPYGESPADG
ncbi:MAG: hypothetical protein ACXWQR_22565 [Ktedonobacterales bacterium]